MIKLVNFERNTKIYIFVQKLYNVWSFFFDRLYVWERSIRVVR